MIVQFIDDLRQDHDRIERVAGAFLAFSASLASNDRVREDGIRFVRFFTEFAGHYHHAREEDTLFTALRERAGLPVEGPIAALAAHHRRLAEMLESARKALTHTGPFESPASGSAVYGATTDAIRAYVHALWQHIDAENSVLLPEGEARLRKQGVRNLTGRVLTAAERTARDDGEALLARYPPVMDDASALRGDGCVCCPLMTVTCGGLEHAWWSEHEWEELEDHLGGD